MENHYIEYYLSQAGHRSLGKKKYRSEKILQKGGGVGGVFSTVFRYLKPYIASGLDILKEESIKTAADVLLGITNQKPVKEVLANRGVEMVDKIRDNAVKKINLMSGGSLEKPLKRLKKMKSNQSTSNSLREITKTRKIGNRKREKDIF